MIIGNDDQGRVSFGLWSLEVASNVISARLGSAFDR